MKRDLVAQGVYELIDKRGMPLKVNTKQVITGVLPFEDGQAIVCLSTMTSKEKTIYPLTDPTGLK